MLPGIIATIAAYAFATTLRLMQPSTRQSRWLARSILATATAFCFWTVVLPLLTDPAAAYATRVVSIMAWVLSLSVYLAFLSTLDAPLTQWLRTRWARIGLTVATIGGMVTPVAFTPLFIRLMFEPVGPHNWFPGSARGLDGLLVLEILTVLVWSFGFAAAYSTYRSARGTAARRQGHWYLLAFGWRDATLIATFMLVVPQLSQNLLPFWADSLDYDRALVYKLNLVLFPMEQLVFYGLVAYGILGARLFDLELKVKKGLSRGILTTIILGSFLIVSQLVENFASEALGLLSGSVVAGVGLLAIRPLMHFSDRVANGAMPNVDDSPEYVAGRKELVFRGAVESALADGAVTAKERRLLVRLQEDLELTPSAAQKLEMSVLNELGASTPR